MSKLKELETKRRMQQLILTMKASIEELDNQAEKIGDTEENVIFPLLMTTRSLQSNLDRFNHYIELLPKN